MERLVTVNDMCERYGCTLPTARKYLREMFHYEKPLVAPLWALREWEQSRECMPSCNRSRAQEIKRRAQTKGRVIVPRER